MINNLYNIAKGPVTYKVFSEGKDLSGSCTFKSIRISKNVNKVASAFIQLWDGGKANDDKFDASNAQYFDPGKAIEIKAGYDSKEETIFKGVVVRHGMKVMASKFLLNIECKDEAVKLTIGRKSALYLEKSDSDIIQEIGSNYGDLTLSVESTSHINPELVQNYTTDWDFVVQRAELNGFIVINSDNTMDISKPKIGSPDIKVSPMTGMVSFNGYIDARNQFKNVKAASWDRENQEVLFEESSNTPSDIGGKLKPKVLSDVMGLDTYSFQTTSAVPSEVLQSWAEGRQIKSGYSKIQGNFSILGFPGIKLGSTIEIEGLSDQFNGKMYVGGFEHIIDTEFANFETVIELGINSNYFNEEKFDIAAPATSGLLSPIKGLLVGVVEQIHEDPNGEFRIKVELPTLEVDNLSVWARQANFYATPEAGLFFYPEIGDEVVVGFLNEDPQSPIVLGSMYNKSNSIPTYEPYEENYIKAIVTKTGLTIEFDEENDIITIKTPEENMIQMNDTEKFIRLSDVNDNIVEMTEDGVNITSAKDINIEAQGDINITAQGNITEKATGDLSEEGMNVAVKATAEYSAEGAMAGVKGSAQTTIEGGIVMIN